MANNSFLSASFIRNMEDTMDWYDHIAFSFLLFKHGDELAALECMQRLIRLYQCGRVEWKRIAIRLALQSAEGNLNAVVETLFHLKQWKLLELMGYSIPTPINRIPKRHLVSFRVGLFCILDQLDRYQVCSLIANMGVRNEFQVGEIVALKWILNGIISTVNCSKLATALSNLDRNDLADLSLQLQSDQVSDSSIAHGHLSKCITQNLPNFPTGDNCSHRYSESSAGYCLIIHQKNIYKERDFRLKHRVEHYFPDYLGNEADCRTLGETFLTLGYEVEVTEDLTNFDLKQKVLDFSRRTDWRRYNGLAICFLSHCIEGRIYGCNSLSISFATDVRKYFNECYCPDLKGKPKTFIFTTRFGSDRTQAPQFDSMKDNHSLYNNFFIIWPTDYILSTTKGGSAFIEEFCSELKTGIETDRFKISIAVINQRCGINHQQWSICYREDEGIK